MHGLLGHLTYRRWSLYGIFKDSMFKAPIQRNVRELKNKVTDVETGVMPDMLLMSIWKKGIVGMSH
jgi:hypothetical protein